MHVCMHAGSRYFILSAKGIQCAYVLEWNSAASHSCMYCLIAYNHARRLSSIPTCVRVPWALEAGAQSNKSICMHTECECNNTRSLLQSSINGEYIILLLFDTFCCCYNDASFSRISLSQEVDYNNGREKDIIIILDRTHMNIHSS